MAKRIRCQLAIQATPDLLARLRAAAAAQGRTTTSCAVEALEAWLAASSVVPTTDAASAHARLEDLERRLEALEGRFVPSAAIPPPSASSPQCPEGERLTTAELAARTGTSRGGWNNWASVNPVGSIRHHTTAGSWRLAGKDTAPSKVGGPSRWLWEPA